MTFNFLQNEIDKNVRRYVASGSGLAGEAVIPGNDNAPAPNGAYASVLLVNKINDGLAGNDNTSAANDSVDVATGEVINYNYLVQFYRSNGGKDVQDLAERLRIFYRTPAGELRLQELGLSLFGWSDVDLIDEIIDSEFERRASITFTFRQKLIDTNNVEAIKSVPIDLIIEEDF